MFLSSSDSFDSICKRHLNKGFRCAERFHAKILKIVKAKLPRRESVRRTHPYARHSDILSAIETRSATYCHLNEIVSNFLRTGFLNHGSFKLNILLLMWGLQYIHKKYSIFRISLLSMTFMKYVDLNLCCFIPGKVIDEIFRVLRIIQEEQYPPRAYEILQVW